MFLELKDWGGALKATDYKQPPQILVKNKGESQHYRLYDEQGLSPTLQSQLGMSSQKHPFVIQKNKSQYDTEDSKPEIGQAKRRYGLKGNSPPLNNWSPLIVAQRGRNPENPKSRKSGLPTKQMLEKNLTGNSNALTGVEKDNYVFDGQVRKLMPIECERLMSWPDNWTKWGVVEKMTKGSGNNYIVRDVVEISDSQRYKMCGNGVVSKVVEEIVKRLF